ncbi:hypothetical protein [Citrobacter farmeri]|uniref:hypothetical protein n=1 Tax=Citrobacter farmeri TaxID=67824 RepID=UPI00163AAABA|nr:hypothetical protein [Citrobacter farmeri]
MNTIRNGTHQDPTWPVACAMPNPALSIAIIEICIENFFIYHCCGSIIKNKNK